MRKILERLLMPYAWAQLFKKLDAQMVQAITRRSTQEAANLLRKRLLHIRNERLLTSGTRSELPPHVAQHEATLARAQAFSALGLVRRHMR